MGPGRSMLYTDYGFGRPRELLRYGDAALARLPYRHGPTALRAQTRFRYTARHGTMDLRVPWLQSSASSSTVACCKSHSVQAAVSPLTRILSNGAPNLSISAIVRGVGLIPWWGFVALHRESPVLAPLAGWLKGVRKRLRRSVTDELRQGLERWEWPKPVIVRRTFDEEEQREVPNKGRPLSG